MEDARISSRQLMFLMTGFIFGSSLVLTPSAESGRNTWIAHLLATGGGACVVLLYSTLAKRFPGKSLVDYSRMIFGTFLGTLVAVLYIWYFLHVAALVIRNFAEFTLTTTLPNTPIVITVGILTFVCASAVRNGIEVLSRCGEVLVPWMVLQILLVLGLLLNTYQPENLLPILEVGWLPVLKDTFNLTTFPFGEVIAFSMILPALKDPKLTIKTAVPAVVIAGLFLTLVIVSDIMVLGGDEIRELPFASYTSSRLVSVGGFLERIEVFVVANLIIGGFLKISVFYYSACLGVAQVIGLKDYRVIVFPIGVFLVSLSILLYDNLPEMLSFAKEYYAWYALPFQFLLPVGMLLLAWLRGLLRGKPMGSNEEQRQQ